MKRILASAVSIIMAMSFAACSSSDSSASSAGGKGDGGSGSAGTAQSAEAGAPINIEKSEFSNPIGGFDDSGELTYGGDPSALVVDDTLYLYVGHDTASNESYVIPEYLCYSTKDMKEWKYEGVMLKMSDVKWADNNSAWAGQVARHYDKEAGKDKYYMYYCSWDSTDGGKQSIGVAVSDSPTGPFEDVGSALVKGSFTTEESSGWNDIDPTVWIEEDDSGEEHRYLAWGNSKLYVCELNEDMVSVKDYDGDGQITFKTDVVIKPNPDSYTEAPWIYRRQDENGKYYGDYYLFYAYGWREQMAYATTDSLMEGRFFYQDVIMKPTATSNTNHMAVVDFLGKTWFIYHNGSLPHGSGFRRVACVEEVKFYDDGAVAYIEETAAANGLINADPYMALRQLGTETHFTGLTAESRRKLLEHTKATIKAREAETRHAEAMEERRQKLEDTITTQKAMILAANNQLSWNDAANLDYNDPLEKAKLLTELAELEEKKEAVQQRQTELSTAVQKREVLVGFTEKEINQAYNEHLAALSGKMDPLTGQQMQVGLVEEAALAVQFKTNKPLDTLTSHLINALEHGITDDVREAASAIQMLKRENSNLLKEIPKRYIAMADYVSDLLPPSININNSTAFNAKEVERARQTYLHSGRTETQEKSIDEVTERQIKDAFSNNPEKFLRLGIDKDEWNKFINTGGIEFKKPGWFMSDKTVNEYGVPHYLQPKLMEDTERWLREAGRLSPMSSLEEKMKYASNKNREIYGVSKYCDYRVMRYPLEKLYPHLKNTPTLDNMIAMRVYQCVMDNYKVNGHGSQVRFIDDDPSTVISTEDFVEFYENYHKKNYAKSAVPIIEARINGKWEKVRVMTRTIDPYKRTVQLFYQIEDGNMMSEVPLTMPSVNPYGVAMPLLDEDEE